MPVFSGLNNTAFCANGRKSYIKPIYLTIASMKELHLFIVSLHMKKKDHLSLIEFSDYCYKRES
jgi:hypothetical protein